MPSYRCTDCGISYPDAKACRVCGGRTDGMSEPYDSDWEAKVMLATAERRELDELERLVAHRTLALLDLDFSVEQIRALPLTRADIAHDAERLLKKGATHEWVVHELRD